MYYAGLDLHRRYLTLCVLDRASLVVREQRKLPPTLEAVTAQLTGLAGPVTVVLEATLQWAWENLRATGTDLFSVGGRAWLATVAVPAPERPALEVTLGLIATVDEQVAAYDPLVRRWARELPEARQLLQSVPGIGAVGAGLILAELGTVTQFASSRELAAYAGLVPSTRSSGGKTAHGGVGPAGNGWLKGIVIEAVQTLKQRPGPGQAHDERLLRAKGKLKATVAAARKLCPYWYWMLREGLRYDEWLQHQAARAGCPVHALASAAE